MLLHPAKLFRGMFYHRNYERFGKAPSYSLSNFFLPRKSGSRVRRDARCLVTVVIDLADFLRLV